jgi:hypothetical protein
MPVPIYRGTFPVVVSESTKRFDRGKIEYTKVQVYSNSNVTTGNIGTSINIDGKYLALTNISVNSKDSLTEVTHTYSGGDSSAPEVYEVVASVQEEPISSHPAFTASIAPFSSSIVDAAGSANVNYDGDNIFVSFGKGADNNFFGVQSYLSPQVSYRRIYSSGSAPTAGITGKVAFIFSDPDGYPPTIASGRNWLQTGVSIKNNGNFKNGVGQWEITEEYKGSGQKGWNNAVYFTA